jgi:hypothetical protein
MDKGIKTTLEFMDKTWKILQQAKRMLVEKKYMPHYQKYLKLSEEICPSFPFKIIYTLWYRSWPKDLDEDYFKSTWKELKKDGNEGHVKKHASSHVEGVCIEEDQMTTYDTSTKLTNEANDTIVLDGEDEDTTSCPTYDDNEKMFQ